MGVISRPSCLLPSPTYRPFPLTSTLSTHIQPPPPLTMKFTSSFVAKFFTASGKAQATQPASPAEFPSFKGIKSFYLGVDEIDEFICNTPANYIEYIEWRVSHIPRPEGRDEYLVFTVRDFATRRKIRLTLMRTATHGWESGIYFWF